MWRIISVACLSILLLSCAAKIRIPADTEVDRIEILDQNTIRILGDNPHLKTITEGETISRVLEFFRSRHGGWYPPLFITPSGRYTLSFHKGDTFEFVLWLNANGICGRNDNEDMHDNRCRTLSISEMEELGHLLSIEYPVD